MPYSNGRREAAFRQLNVGKYHSRSSSGSKSVGVFFAAQDEFAPTAPKMITAVIPICACRKFQGADIFSGRNLKRPDKTK